MGPAYGGSLALSVDPSLLQNSTAQRYATSWSCSQVSNGTTGISPSSASEAQDSVPNHSIISSMQARRRFGKVNAGSSCSQKTPQFHCFLLDNGIPLQYSAIVSDAQVESFTKKIKKSSLGFSLETVPVVIACEVEIRQIQHSGFKGFHHCDISYPAERFLQVIHERPLRLVICQPKKETRNFHAGQCPPRIFRMRLVGDRLVCHRGHGRGRHQGDSPTPCAPLFLSLSCM